MKLLVLSRGRTCSSAISQSLAHKYNTEYFGESYFVIHEWLLNYYSMRPNHDRNIVFDKFREKIEDHTKFIFSHEKLVSKIFPSVLSYPSAIMWESDTFQSVKNKWIFNLDIINIKKYDQIYFLDRDFYTSAISWVYAKKTKKFFRRKTNNQKYPVISLEAQDFAVVKFYIIDYLMQQKIKLYLIENNIPTIFIDESNYNEYIDESYLSITKTDRDYSKHITNMDELKEFLDKWYPICEKETKDWNFY